MRRDKINTLLMKQDFMVYEQQEPRGKRRVIQTFFLDSILTFFFFKGQELRIRTNFRDEVLN